MGFGCAGASGRCRVWTGAPLPSPFLRHTVPTGAFTALPACCYGGATVVLPCGSCNPLLLRHLRRQSCTCCLPCIRPDPTALSWLQFSASESRGSFTLKSICAVASGLRLPNVPAAAPHPLSGLLRPVRPKAADHLRCTRWRRRSQLPFRRTPSTTSKPAGGVPPASYCPIQLRFQPSHCTLNLCRSGAKSKAHCTPFGA